LRKGGYFEEGRILRKGGYFEEGRILRKGGYYTYKSLHTYTTEDIRH
jgi:hypothetical protein